MSIAVLVRENFLMIFDTKLKFYLEYKYSNEESKTFLNFCEESIFEFINQVGRSFNLAKKYWATSSLY